MGSETGAWRGKGVVVEQVQSFWEDENNVEMDGGDDCISKCT